MILFMGPTLERRELITQHVWKEKGNIDGNTDDRKKEESWAEQEHSKAYIVHTVEPIIMASYLVMMQMLLFLCHFGIISRTTHIFVMSAVLCCVVLSCLLLCSRYDNSRFSRPILLLFYFLCCIVIGCLCDEHTNSHASHSKRPEWKKFSIVVLK